MSICGLGGAEWLSVISTFTNDPIPYYILQEC